MWVIFDKLEHRTGLKSAKTGKTYDAWVLMGTKKGYDEPDSPYEKLFFDNTTTTIIEKGIRRPNLSAVQFLQQAVKPGDVLELKSEKRGRNWELVSIENKTKNAPSYTPLSEEQVAEMLNATTSLAPPVREPRDESEYPF